MDHYETSARLVREQIASVTEDWCTSVEGGYMAGVLQRVVNATRDNISSVADQLDELRAECERRSGVCEAHDDEIRSYNNRKRWWNKEAEKGPFPGPAPTKPIPDEPWITASVRIEE